MEQEGHSIEAQLMTAAPHWSVESRPIAVNFHMLALCNAKCRFCFAVFDDVPGQLSRLDALELVERLAAAGTQKLTFVGGEPTLHANLGELLQRAKELGMVTCVVTNGARLDRLLDGFAEFIDWIGLSVDSADDATQERLGRGRAGYIAKCVRLAQRCHALEIQVKLNTVVTSLNHEQDMGELVRAIAPARWKVFQVLPVQGQNTGKVEELEISAAQYAAYVRRHAYLNAQGFAPVVEDNAAMRGSYVMVDPLGRFFDNAAGGYRYSQAILQVGVQRALGQVSFSEQKFLERGGAYDW